MVYSVLPSGFDMSGMSQSHLGLGTLTRWKSRLDIKVEISIFFKDGFQYQYELKSFRKWGYVVTTCVFFL